jgi:hypothetical protein
MLNLNYNVLGSQRDKTVRKAPPLPFGEFYIQLQVVGGGGAGSPDIGGGGGAGGVQYVPAYLINDQRTYTVNIAPSSSGYYAWRAVNTGSGWNSDPPIQSNRSGSNSWFRDDVTLQDIIGYGGGMGGGPDVNASGNQGGSGGGGSEFTGAGGPYIGLFNTGSTGGDAGPSNYPGGGGGAGAGEDGRGGNTNTVAFSSQGGVGIPILGFDSGSYPTSASVSIAGGGAGGSSVGHRKGGIGGGGDNGTWTGDPLTSIRPQNGTPNTGGGGGGLYGVVPNQYTSSFDTGGGASGLVVIFYKGLQKAYGGEVLTRELNDGFYTQHIYTASGQFIPVSHL